MTKSKKERFAKSKQAELERVSSRAQEAVKNGIVFEYFKKIADDSVIPESESVLAGYKK
jgi:hypothetical protein